MSAGIQPEPDGAAALSRVLERTRGDVSAAKAARAKENERLVARGKRPKPFSESLSFAIYFAKYVSGEIAAALEKDFPGVRSGETPSQSFRGLKRVDLNYSTPEAGLGLAISFKSVHFGERLGGNADFIHNMKRNDEEFRVEATAHHLRQPYAVFVAAVFLPFEACSDSETSSFASWVEYLWPLKGRTEPEDPPDRFELVFVALYARDGSDLRFYEVGGKIKCPRTGLPRSLLTLGEFLHRVTTVYNQRNGLDFFYEDEEPAS
jgi:hypothetical protein